MVPSRDHDILAYDMFAADRDSDITLFSDRMVTTRKPHVCVICGCNIAPGLRVRARRERDNTDRVVMTFYACPPCCDAMTASWADGGRAITARTAIGLKTFEAD